MKPNNLVYSIFFLNSAIKFVKIFLDVKKNFTDRISSLCLES